MCLDQWVNHTWINPEQQWQSAMKREVWKSGMLEMVDLVAGHQIPRQQMFPTKKNQRCEDWNGPEEQGEKATLGAKEEGPDCVGDGDDHER